MDVAELEARDLARMFQDDSEWMRTMRHRYIGLSLGTRREMTGLCVLEQLGELRSVRHLERFKAGTTYPDIVARVAAVVKDVRNLPVRAYSEPNLIIDITAVGPPVLGLFTKAIDSIIISGATMTGGYAVNAETYRNVAVPKRDLVSTVEVLLQTGRLKIAPKLEEADALARALEGFQLKRQEIAADSTSMLWREESEDDLVFAVALSCWEAGRAHHCMWA